ncbi:MAG TPA: hypothetical protein VFV71_05270 [Burkholderiales bacterium]|nr:hypothetical protein [Burkholderiales bacterium]
MQKSLIAALALVAAALCPLQSSAERVFPQAARRGDMKAYSYPAMKIGDYVYRLSPGSRIFNEQNLIIMPASLQRQLAPIMYTLDMRGDLAEVWLLTSEEAARRPLPK